MRGLQLVRLLDVLPITSAQNAVGVEPRSVIIQAPALNNVESVLINGMQSPSFVVYSPTELIAQVPEPIEDAVLTDFAVLSATPTLTNRSIIEFTLGTRVRAVQGPQRLIQNFVRLLLRTTGTNIFHKTLGGSLFTSVGETISKRVAADIAIAVSRTKQQIIAAQTPYSAIPAEERLLSAEVAGVTPDIANAAVYVTVILTTHSRDRSAATFVS
jgi:hypothetical protein